MTIFDQTNWNIDLLPELIHQSESTQIVKITLEFPSILFFSFLFFPLQLLFFVTLTFGNSTPDWFLILLYQICKLLFIHILESICQWFMAISCDLLSNDGKHLVLIFLFEVNSCQRVVDGG